MIKIQVTCIAHHRNGICGDPFWAVAFKMQSKEAEIQNMVATLFHGGQCTTAVLDANMAAKGNVNFFDNSWRGDQFHDALWEVIKKWENNKNVGLEFKPTEWITIR